ncbi:adenosylcobinamide-GDP ribazoletransferase [Shewanella schlegeliana]|uniref:Adenosylcobinamide-GDP ribazoletransferase n=1 Tax=Shewanella schlegeliana TaxID=190308 RepID=A0ABS1SZR8_9GAMM|nr:adenosylcobinamide-GDP ribazoletransferase [Shewanella schlegeliana]MBL4914024.1 adenosylcobinamide-GDP ribazoletransferase [Shewanella schlegeliana]MCL1108593.1 adenosylcobinamide-GDP ribazoletransferase [Shewanella schlegeliana]GIU35706.1 adenosylcobinamide-GDP ribazoletransferase [Shewanella schlegeliana]
MKRHLGAILAAASFLTRLPMPAWVAKDSAAIAQSSRWFALVGLLIGLIAATLLYILTTVMGQALAVVMTLVLIIVLTGAFHEDGLADLCDGFGGGWEKSRKLAIMKDSQIGAYGVLALVSAFAIKVTALIQLPLDIACISLIACHAGSRAIAGLVAVYLPYAREDSNNKTPQKDAPLPFSNRIILCVSGILPLLLLPISCALMLLAVWLTTFIGLIKLMQRHIQGYTGDTLGATQQIIEIAGLIFLVIYYFQSPISN